jgi:hypothetical protein
MRKVLLISLAAVIVAGGFAMAAYGAEGEGRRGPPQGRRPGAEGERRGPPRVELNEDQRAALENDPEVKKARAALQAAVAKFQKVVMEIVKDERAARMIMFRAIMQRVRPAGEGDRGRERDRDRERDRRPERPKKRPE